MTEKKSAAITIHLPESIKSKFDRLGNRKGMGAGEYVLNALMLPHLSDLEDELSVLREILGQTENHQNDGNCK